MRVNVCACVSVCLTDSYLIHNSSFPTPDSKAYDAEEVKGRCGKEHCTERGNHH